MIKTISTVISTVALASLLAPSVMGMQISVARIGGYYTGSGGEFNIAGTGANSGYAGVALYNNPFANATGYGSFCLEFNEGINLPDIYNAEVNTKAINGGVGPEGDPISNATAWLYKQFATGQLQGYDYNGNRAASAGALQQAIWYLENEGGSNNGYVQLAMNTVVDPLGDANGNFDVYVLNVTKLGRGGLAQDQLIYLPTTVPDGGLTLSMMGAGLIGLAFIRRK
jgi:hypothetical protein